MPDLISQDKPYHRYNAVIPDRAWNSTVSLAIVHNENELHQFGTGTLLRVGECCFVVTAGHVVKMASENKRALLIPITNSTFIHLPGGYCTDDIQDVGVIRLTKSDIDSLKNKSFLQLLDIGFYDDLVSRVFGVFGYPAKLADPATSKNNQLVLQPFQFVTYAYDGYVDALGHYDEKVHLLLKADKISSDSSGKPLTLFDRQGKHLKFPKDLGGISGCSVWMVGNRNKLAPKSQLKYPKVVAVETAVYPDTQIIKATKWICVSTLLWEAFPEVRTALQLSRI
jgi:hypothetical protein